MAELGFCGTCGEVTYRAGRPCSDCRKAEIEKEKAMTKKTKIATKKPNPSVCKCGQHKLASFKLCVDCAAREKKFNPDVCVCGQFVHVNGKLCVDCAEEKKQQDAEDELDALRKQYDISRPVPPKLKLFKVTIPSQTIRGEHKGKKLVVGQIEDYGFIQGREIFVLATSQGRLWKQCLRELGCVDNPADVDLRVEEVEGPFEHGYVIAYTQPNGL